MKFSTRQDVDLPAADLFSAISDFSRFERILARRRTEVRRLDPAQEAGAGMAWDLAFNLRGKRRALRLQVTQFDRPERVAFAGHIDSLDLTIDMTVIALSRIRSRLIFETAVRPRNMGGRLMLQTARLGKARLDRKFAAQVGDLVKDLTANRADAVQAGGRQDSGGRPAHWPGQFELARRAAGR